MKEGARKITEIDTGAIVDAIIGEDKTPNNTPLDVGGDVYRLNDMTTFPKITGMKNTSFLPCGFNNKVVFFYSPDDLEERTGFRLITYLKGKFVTYAFVLENGRGGVLWYFGHTGDVGERITTHDKDARTGLRRLHKDLKRMGRALFIVLGAFDSLEEATTLESKLITDFKDSILKQKTGYGLCNWPLNEANDITKDYIYNIANG